MAAPAANTQVNTGVADFSAGPGQQGREPGNRRLFVGAGGYFGFLRLNPFLAGHHHGRLGREGFFPDQLGFGQQQGFARGQFFPDVRFQPITIDEGAVGAAQVFDFQSLAHQPQLGVVTRGAGVGQDNVIVQFPPNFQSLALIGGRGELFGLPIRMGNDQMVFKLITAWFGWGVFSHNLLPFLCSYFSGIKAHYCAPFSRYP